MFKILAALGCVVILYWNKEFRQVEFTANPKYDSTVLKQILDLDLKSFIGKPADSLFRALPGGYTTRGFMPTGIGYAIGLDQSYYTSEFNSTHIQIYIDKFVHLKFPNRTSTTKWDMEMAKKEIVSFIKVIKNQRECMFGCDNDRYNH